ncbi:hypothetical protein ACHAQA_010038 [Verticillium albo-atrum]
MEQNLRCFGPSTGESQACCLVMVLRGIFSVLPPSERAEMAAQNNAFLAFAVDNNAIASSGAATRMAALVEELRLTFKGTHTHVFAKLAESESMLKTVWSTTATKLWKSVHTRTKQGEQWSSWTESYDITDSLAAAQALIDFDMNKEEDGVTLSEVANRRIAGYAWGSDSEIYFQFAYPTIVRVQFSPKNRKPDFVQLQQFKMGRQPSWYRLFIAVRMRAAQEEPDLVRLYTPYGVRMVTRPANCASEPVYMAPGWDVGAPGHVYMLYYVHFEGVFDNDPGSDKYTAVVRSSEAEDFKRAMYATLDHSSNHKLSSSLLSREGEYSLGVSLSQLEQPDPVERPEVLEVQDLDAH